MRLTISRNELFDALQRIQSVVEKKNTVQILSNVLCSAKDNQLSLFATDLEVGLRVVLPCKVLTEGKITLQAKQLAEIVRELPEGTQVDLSRKSNDWVELVCGKSRFNLVSLPAEQYPTVPAFDDKSYHSARSKSLAEMIDRTGFAVSTDQTRFMMTGVYFEPTQNRLMRMVGTDGHRLSFIDHEVFLSDPGLRSGVIIPKKGLGELRKFLDLGEEETGLAFDGTSLYARQNGVCLFVRLIDGDYPDYKLVIPKGVDLLVRVDRQQLIAALKRVSLLSHEKSRGVKFQVQKDLLTILSSNPDSGDAREEVECRYSGEALEIGFNAKYLLDCLPVMDSPEVEIRLKDRLSPGIVQGSSSRNHSYIVMPMRI